MPTVFTLGWPQGEGATAMSPPTVGRPAGDAADGGSGKITRDAVLAAALEIIDRDGTGALSMRRLARVLDRDPMILYRHTPGKGALLDGVAETVLAQLQVDSADPDWTGQLREVARRFRALALAHPHVGPLAGPRPPASPGRHPDPAPPGRVQRARRPAHLPGPVRVPARPRPGRTAGTHRQPRRDRRPAAARPAPAGHQRIPPAPPAR